MMGMALSGKWASPDAGDQAPAAEAPKTETLEAEIVEPAEVGNQKWGASHPHDFSFHEIYSFMLRLQFTGSRRGSGGVS